MALNRNRGLRARFARSDDIVFETLDPSSENENVVLVYASPLRHAARSPALVCGLAWSLLTCLALAACEPPCPPGTIPSGGRCLEDAAHPGADAGDSGADTGGEAPDACAPSTEICDGEDNDCDGSTDEGTTMTYYADADGDGYGGRLTREACAPGPGIATSSDDCDDARPEAHPAASEACDGRDDDCDGSVDEAVQTTFYQDLDADGHGDPAVSVLACAAPPGHTTSPLDCNDRCGTCRPGEAETCDRRDNDCDAAIDEGVLRRWALDCDGDGYLDASPIEMMACDTPAAPASCPLGFYLDPAGAPGPRDCADWEPLARPGQTLYFETPIAGAAPGRAFDYDCDGVESRRYTAQYDCPSCRARPGWYTTAIPNCAASADFVASCMVSGGACRPVRAPAAQPCR